MVQSSALMHMPSISLHLNNAQPASEEDQLPVLERSWHRAPNGAGAGLANMGNTCYMNSVLQCLAHLPPLANIVHAQSHSRSCSHYQQGSTCICCLVENQLWQQLYYGNRSPFKPDKLYDGLLQLRRGFQRWRQEDAHELLRCLTDAMEGCLLRQSLGYNPQRPPRCPKTWVNLMFSGILQSQVRCLRCGYVSNSYDPFMDLSLELHNSCRQLGHCLQHFTAAETLDGKNSYRCDGCKQLVPARKQITIWDDPNILVVHLKRFHDFSGQKINQPIQFPMSLDLEPFLCPTRALQQQQQQQQQQHSLLGPARPLQQQQQQPGVAVFTGSGYTRVGGGAVGGVGPGWGAGDQQRQQQQQQEKLLMHQQHQQHQHLLQKKAAGQQQQQHSWQQQEQQHDGACANGSSSSGNRSSPGVYDLHGVLVHKGCTANSGHYYSYVRGGNPATQWFCANDSSVYRVQGPAEVMGQTRDAYMLFYVRRSMKQQAELPVQPEPPAAAAAAAAAAPAAVAAGLRKRALSSADGNGSPDSCSTRVFVGPQLPPHLQKRQRVAEQQQRQEAADVDMFADEEEPSAAVAAAIGPQLPSDWRPSAAAKAAAAAIGPQLPPGWKPSAAAAAASGNGSSAASESTAGLTAVDVVQAAAVLLPHDAAAEPSTQHGTAAAGAALSPAAAAAHAPEARAAGAAGGGSLLQRAAAAQLPAASPAAAAAAAAVPLSSVSGDGDGSGALAGMLAGYGDDDDDDADIAPAPTQTSPQQQHQKQLPAPQEQQHLPQPQPAQQPERARGSNAGSAARSRRSSSGGGAAAAIDTVVTPVMLKSELWDAIAERKQAFKPTLVAELEKARDEGTPLPQVKPVLLTLFRGSAAVKEAAESVLSHAVKIAQSALSACL